MRSLYYDVDLDGSRLVIGTRLCYARATPLLGIECGGFGMPEMIITSPIKNEADEAALGNLLPTTRCES